MMPRPPTSTLFPYTTLFRSITTLEGTAHTFTAAEFGFTDPLRTEEHTLVLQKHHELVCAGPLEQNGVAVTAGQFIAVVDIADLVFTPATAANGTACACCTSQ